MHSKTLLNHITRTLLGLVFTFSGFVKVIDPLGTTYKIEDYLAAMGLNSLLPIAFAAAMCLVTAEFVLGLCLLSNIKTHVTPWLVLLFMIVMTPLTLWIAITNPVTDCGCFGDALILSNWATFWKNIALLILTAILLWCRKDVRPWMQNRYQLMLAAGYVIISLCISVYCLTHLPLIDFRPYKVGTDIEQSMFIPENAPQDRYETVFIYERNGEQREFTLDNYPKDDPSWVFVDSHSTLIEKGYEPPIHDFNIILMDVHHADISEETDFSKDTDYSDYAEDFEDVEDADLFADTPDYDITEQIIHNPGTTLLAILYDLDKTDMTQAAKLEGIYQQAIKDGNDFYALTGSGWELVRQFADQTGATYPFCSTDPVTLKTIIRANPGLVIVKDGIIVSKHNLRQL
ncbi:MAG: DoxX family protein [Paludibacteraceae bacterium]|nr:DoxX family protein [Paludibacteraceae bacterium]